NYIHNFSHPEADYHSDIWQTFNNNPAGPTWTAAARVTVEYNHVFMGESGALTSEDTGSIHIFMWADSYPTFSDKCSDLVVRNNIFEANGGADTQNGHSDNSIFENNLWRSSDGTLVNSAPGISLANSSGVVIRNNMFIDGTQGVHVFSGVTGTTFSNNLFWRHGGGSTTNFSYSSTGDVVNQNPLFVDAASGQYDKTVGYKVQAGSPAI